MDLSARVMELNLNAYAARDVWGLVSEMQYAADYDAAWIEYCRIEELAELHRRGSELGHAQRAGYHIPPRDEDGEPVASPVKYVWGCPLLPRPGQPDTGHQ